MAFRVGLRRSTRARHGADDLRHRRVASQRSRPRSSVRGSIGEIRHGFQSPVNATARQNAASPPLNFHGKQPRMSRLFCSSGVVDVAAEVLDVHAVLREQRVVRELIRRVREELRHALRAAEFVFALLAHAIAVSVHALAEKAADRQVHRMVGRDAVHAPDVNLLVEQPRHHVGMRARMAMDVLLLVRLGSELRVLFPARVQEEQVALLHLDAILDHLRRVDRRARPSRRRD